MTGVRNGKDVDKRSLTKERERKTGEAGRSAGSPAGKKKTSKRRTTVFLHDNEKDAATKKQICQELNCKN